MNILLTPQAFSLPSGLGWRPSVSQEATLPVTPVKEGFNHEESRVPDFLKSAWYSTFFVLFDFPDRYHFGSSFLVGKKKTGKSTELYFLTSAHVVKDCTKKGVCPHSSVSTNAVMIETKRGMEMGHLERNLGKFEIIKRSQNPDLALLKVKTKKIVSDLEPVEFVDSCEYRELEEVYAIGFPNTYSRKASQSLPIARKNEIIKRWSEGFFLEESVNNTDDGLQIWAATTADALGGASGGPLVDSQGKVKGVIKNSAGTRENEYRYDGNENLDELDWHSNAVPCEEMKNFLSEFNL